MKIVRYTYNKLIQTGLIVKESKIISIDDLMIDSSSADKPQTFVREDRKVGRNEKCPCGSGKKYTQCHGRAA